MYIPLSRLFLCMICSLDSLLTSVFTVSVETDVERSCVCLVFSVFVKAIGSCCDYISTIDLVKPASVQVLRQVVGSAHGTRLAINKFIKKEK